MKKYYLLICLFSYGFSFSQTGVYDKADKLMHIVYDIPLAKYPLYEDLEEDAIEFYNKATNAILTNPDLAITYYVKAIQADNKFVQAYDNIGKAYRMLEKYDLAIKYYNRSIEIFPNGVFAYQNLAIVYEFQNKYDDVINAYKKVIDINPYSAEGYYGLGNTYLYDNKFNLALINAKKALDIYKVDPPNYIGDSYAQVGLIHFYLGNKSEAKKYIQIAKEKYITNNLEQTFKDYIPSVIIKELSIE